MRVRGDLPQPSLNTSLAPGNTVHGDALVTRDSEEGIGVAHAPLGLLPNTTHEPLSRPSDPEHRVLSTAGMWLKSQEEKREKEKQPWPD